MSLFTKGGQGLNVNNAIRDPLQGFDANVWVVDQATGIQTLVGSFVSIQIIVRNSSEPYMDLNQTVTRILDGVWQFGWVMERGMIDTRVLEQTWGISSIQREMRLGRMPRFMISYELNAPELDESLYGETLQPEGEVIIGQRNKFTSQRRSRGQYRLINCKVDSLTKDIRAGQSVIANRWEGLAEGIVYIDDNSTWPGTVVGESTSRSGQELTIPDLQFSNNGAPSWATSGTSAAL